MSMFIEYTDRDGKKVIRNLNNIISITSGSGNYSRIVVKGGTFSQLESEATTDAANYDAFRQALLTNGLLISNDDLVRNVIGWRVTTEAGQVYEVKCEKDAFNIKNRAGRQLIFEDDPETTLDNSPAIFF